MIQRLNHVTKTHFFSVPPSAPLSLFTHPQTDFPLLVARRTRCTGLTEVWAKISSSFIDPIPVVGGKSESNDFSPALWARARASRSSMHSPQPPGTDGGRVGAGPRERSGCCCQMWASILASKTNSKCSPPRFSPPPENWALLGERAVECRRGSGLC